MYMDQFYIFTPCVIRPDQILKIGVIEGDYRHGRDLSAVVIKECEKTRIPAERVHYPS